MLSKQYRVYVGGCSFDSSLAKANRYVCLQPPHNSRIAADSYALECTELCCEHRTKISNMYCTCAFECA